MRRPEEIQQTRHVIAAELERLKGDRGLTPSDRGSLLQSFASILGTLEWVLEPEGTDPYTLQRKIKARLDESLDAICAAE